MNLKNNSTNRLIYAIMITNLCGIMFIYLLIACYIETRSLEYLYGLFFILFFVAMDVLFFSIRKIAFSKVFIEDGIIKEVYFKKTLKEINIKDIKFIYVDVEDIFIRSSEISLEETGYGRQLNKLLYSKETIHFRMNLNRSLDIFEPSIIKLCYVSNRVSKELKDKISSYMSIVEIDWEKQILKELLAEAKKIIEQCDIALSNPDYSANFNVINNIKKEFVEIVHSIETTNTIPVLNKKRRIYSTFLIIDSADLNMNKDLFDRVDHFAEKLKKISKQYIRIKESI